MVLVLSESDEREYVLSNVLVLNYLSKWQLLRTGTEQAVHVTRLPLLRSFRLQQDPIPALFLKGE